MNIIKPLTLATLHKPYSLGGKHYLSMGVLGFFGLGQSNPRFLLETLQWPKALKHLPAEQPLDMAMPKGRAEFIVGGNAYSAQGAPVEKMQISASLGDLSKTLNVYGDRQWYYGALGSFHIGPAQPFTRMPLGYENAFGGKGSKQNPIGKGYSANRLAWLWGKNKAQMPNLEYPQNPIRGHSAAKPPASMGSIDIRWSPRTKRAGTYDQQWVKHSFPALADDTDMRLFNQAAEDQWAGTSWQGGEAYSLCGMHPSLEEISGQLPDFRTRVLLQRQVQEQSMYDLVELSPDTVWFFPEEELGLIIYRGISEVADSDALDVKSMLMAYENPGQTPRSKQHYQAVMQRRLNPETKAGEVLNEAPLIPQPSAVHLSQRQAGKEAEQAAQQSRTQAFIDELENETALPEDLAPAAASESAMEASIRVPEAFSEQLSLDDIASGGIDLGDAIKDLNQQVEQLKQEKEQELADEQQRLETLFADLGDEADSGSHKEEQQWQQALTRAQHLPMDLHPQLGAQDPDTAALLQALEDSEEQGSGQPKAEVEANLDDLEAQKRQARAVQIALDTSRERLSDGNGKRLGEWFAARLQSQTPLAISGRDLMDIQLPNSDFSGLDLREVNFECADLRGCSFVDADLRGANLLAANLTGANFSRAKLAKANLSQANCTATTFDQADLDFAFMVGAKLAKASIKQAVLTNILAQNAQFIGADLSGSNFTKAILVEINASGSFWQDALLSKCVLSKSVLENADFSGVSMERAVLNSVKARGSIWNGCSAVRCFLGADSDFSESTWSGADLRTCGMRQSNYLKADMRGASFFQCDFSLANMQQTAMADAVLCRSLFTQAQMQNSDLRGADFHQAICRKTDFTGSDLSRANMTQVDRIGVLLKNTRLDQVLEQVA